MNAILLNSVIILFTPSWVLVPCYLCSPLFSRNERFDSLLFSEFTEIIGIYIYVPKDPRYIRKAVLLLIGDVIRPVVTDYFVAEGLRP